MIYDLEPGRLIETDRVLGADEVEKARAKLAAGSTLDKVAKDLGGKVFEPPPLERSSLLMVDGGALGEVLEAAYTNDEERNAALAKLTGEGRV